MNPRVDRAPDDRSRERRGVRGAHDVGARTRATGQPSKPSTPHSLQVWMSTFELRWAEHLATARKKRPQAG
jgi:hypothetical protein